MNESAPQELTEDAQSIVLSIDAMGGDHGPASVVQGLYGFARRHPDVGFIVHGNSNSLEDLVNRLPDLKGRCQIRHSDAVVGMEDRPSHVMRHGRGTSMWGALQSVHKNEATVAVSCGNTGALLALSMIHLRKAPHVNRPAIAILWPTRDPVKFNVVLDVGADIRADAEDLLKYALMGVSYARTAYDLREPRVGLLNVGTEEHKGRDELRQAHELIRSAAETNRYRFKGFVEGGDLPSEHVDVVVTDGFTGNIALKAAEGTASLIDELLNEAFRYSPLSRIGALFSYASLRRFKRRIDPRRVNGGVFLGLNGTVVKSHGSADATSVEAAVALAYRLAKLRFHEKLVARVASVAFGNVDDHAGSEGVGRTGSVPSC